MPCTDRLSTYCTTWAHDAEGCINVTYHQTVIVREVPGAIILNNGGYDTVTTRRKMNQAANQFGLHYGVYQKNFVTYITWQGFVYEWSGSRAVELREDGVSAIEKDGSRRKLFPVKER